MPQDWLMIWKNKIIFRINVTLIPLTWYIQQKLPLPPFSVVPPPPKFLSTLKTHQMDDFYISISKISKNCGLFYSPSKKQKNLWLNHHASSFRSFSRNVMPSLKKRCLFAILDQPMKIYPSQDIFFFKRFKSNYLHAVLINFRSILSNWIAITLYLPNYEH